MAMKSQGRKSGRTPQVVNHSHAGQPKRNYVCSGGGAGPGVELCSNSRPLKEFVQQDTVRSKKVYNWKTGEFQDKKLDLVTNAQRHIAKHKVCLVTTNRRDNMKEKDENYYGDYSPAVPTIGGRED